MNSDDEQMMYARLIGGATKLLNHMPRGCVRSLKAMSEGTRYEKRAVIIMENMARLYYQVKIFREDITFDAVGGTNGTRAIPNLYLKDQ